MVRLELLITDNPFDLRDDLLFRKRLIGMLCYWRAIEPDNTYASDSIAALKRLEKGY